ncbi:MAG: type 2 isopentenyl-diphosphate Delta-isomerase [Myxococcales bacterium]|nr:type 2 isopentenyl-diphosphate Delta-isomerase [Myxococcales bacterium]
MSEIKKRKSDHLELCATDDVAYRGRTTLLEHVLLPHQSLPELALDELDTSVSLFGKRLRAPILIASMTGGSESSAEVNRELSAIAEARGYGFGVGSQRAMQRAPETAWTYEVRKHAPTTLLLGNVGVVQARDTETAQLDQLVKDIGADALCVHMNPAQELIQPEGDRDFRGCVDAYRRLAAELSVPVLAKETGNGISRQTAATLRQVGVETVDVSGAGGTSWVGVEALRADADTRAVGEVMWDWGIPTAASVVYAREAGLVPIATGGIKSGLDVARALALGAHAAGIARPVLQALREGGRQGAEAFLERVERELRTAMILSGARTVGQLRQCTPVLTGELREWLAGGG